MPNVPEEAAAAIEAAQEAGTVDRAWEPDDLLILLFGLGLAWAHWPDPMAETEEPEAVARRRAAVVDAAARVITPRTGSGGRAPLPRKRRSG